VLGVAWIKAGTDGQRFSEKQMLIAFGFGHQLI
jgi:hypothetical protein